MQGSKLIQEQPGLGVGWPRTNQGMTAPLVLPGGSKEWLARFPWTHEQSSPG